MNSNLSTPGETGRDIGPAAARRAAAFVSHVPLSRMSGGGGYSRVVFALFSRFFTIRPLAPGDDHPEPSRLGCVARGIASRRPSKSVYAEATGLAGILSGATFPDGDVLVLNGPDALGLVERTAGGAPFVLICHNLEADTFARQVARQPLPVRLLLAGDVRRYHALEDRAFRSAALIVAISEIEAAALRRRYPDARVVHVPPCFGALPAAKQAYLPRSPLRFGFVGKMSWWPNRDAVDWLSSELLHPMPAGRELHLFGAGSEAWHDPARGIHGHGFVEDASAIWNGVDVMLCPMRDGGGVNIKVVDTLARQTPLATTSFGLNGLGLGPADRPGLRVIDGTEAWRDFLHGDDVFRFAGTAPDPDLARQFLADRYEPRLRSALKDAGLLP